MRFQRKSWRRTAIARPEDWRPRTVTVIGVRLGGDRIGARRTGSFRVVLMPVSLAALAFSPHEERNAWRREALVTKGAVL